jgi:flagellar biosynthesis/type III secretory pathway protein FliH
VEETQVTLSYRRIPQAKIDGPPYPVTGRTGIENEAGAACATEEMSREDETAQKLEQAYTAGYQAARAECTKEMEDQIGQKAASFTTMVDDLISQRQRLISESERAVVQLACTVARRIIGETVKIDEQVIVDIVKNALRHLSDKQKLAIRVNPEDLETLKKYETEWMAAARGCGTVEIEEDSRIKRGGCLVEGESGNVEAQIDRQIEVIDRALVEAAR